MLAFIDHEANNTPPLFPAFQQQHATYTTVLAEYCYQYCQGLKQKKTGQCFPPKIADRIVSQNLALTKVQSIQSMPYKEQMPEISLITGRVTLFVKKSSVYPYLVQFKKAKKRLLLFQPKQQPNPKNVVAPTPAYMLALERPHFFYLTSLFLAVCSFSVCFSFIRFQTHSMKVTKPTRYRGLL